MRIARNVIPLLLLVAGSVSAERGLTIDAVNLNGFTAKEIAVRPGARISGTVTISTTSSAIFRTHTGVWLPSWSRNRESMKVFQDGIGGADGVVANIDIPAPSDSGTYYLLFSFDRKHADEMFQEITLRTNEEIHANGHAIKIRVDPLAVEPPPPPVGLAETMTLEVGAPAKEGVAGFGALESRWKIAAGSLSCTRDDAIRFRLVGQQPEIDLDLEILDERGHRRGYSDADGSREESSVVHISPGEILYARIFAVTRGERAPYRISAERVSLSAARRDPSGGKSIVVGDGYSATARAGAGLSGAWYAIPLTRDGRIEVEVRGEQPVRDIDLWLYDDLGNARVLSREEGSRLETAVLDPAESGVYYVRVSAFRKNDESDFRINVKASGAAISTPTTPAVPTPGWPASSGSTSGDFDTVQKVPVAFEISRGHDFDGFIKIAAEPSFLIEIFTGWGELGKIDSLAVYAPDGAPLWEKKATGKGWEADKIITRGPGRYRILLRYSGDGIRKGRIDITGLADPQIYRGRSKPDLGTGGPGLDSAEKEVLRRLYDMMRERAGPAGEISTEEAELLRKMEEYFTNH